MPVPPNTLYLAEQYVLERLLAADNGFNGYINLTAETYNVRPFRLATTGPGQSLFLGRFTMADVQKAVGSGSTFSFPTAVLSIAKGDSAGQQALRVTPSIFSGQVIVSLDFYISYDLGSLPEDANAMFCAVFDALAMALCERASYNVVPPGLGFNNEITIEQGRMEWDGTRWIQFIPVAIFFNVVA